jgi:hypothetical protein
MRFTSRLPCIMGIWVPYRPDQSDAVLVLVCLQLNNSTLYAIGVAGNLLVNLHRDGGDIIPG